MNLNHAALLEIQSRARNVLKALKGDDGSEKKAPVPDPPKDETRTDPRVEDASPTAEDLAAAKAEGSEKDPDDLGSDGAGDVGTSTDGGDGTDGSEDGEDGGFDEFGHKDMDPREVKKAFPKIGHLFPDQALEEIEDNETAPGQTPKVLGELMEAFKGMSDVLVGIKAELERLKKGSEVQGRDLKKALESNQALESRLSKLHETVPAAPEGPRAVSKALDTAQDAQSFTTPELNQLASSKQMNSSEIALLCLTAPRR